MHQTRSPRLDATQHTVSNHMIDVDGDRAARRAYLHSQHVHATSRVASLRDGRQDRSEFMVHPRGVA